MPFQFSTFIEHILPIPFYWWDMGDFPWKTCYGLKSSQAPKSVFTNLCIFVVILLVARTSLVWVTFFQIDRGTKIFPSTVRSRAWTCMPQMAKASTLHNEVCCKCSFFQHFLENFIFFLNCIAIFFYIQINFTKCKGKQPKGQIWSHGCPCLRFNHVNNLLSSII